MEEVLACSLACYVQIRNIFITKSVQQLLAHIYRRSEIFLRLNFHLALFSSLWPCSHINLLLLYGKENILPVYFSSLKVIGEKIFETKVSWSTVQQWRVYTPCTTMVNLWWTLKSIGSFAEVFPSTLVTVANYIYMYGDRMVTVATACMGSIIMVHILHVTVWQHGN